MRLLLSTRRFFPLFVTQFLGAFNDNLFKNAMVILVTYRIAAENSAQAAMIVNIAYGLFILPFFLFSPLAGQIADKIDRAVIARLVKLAEIGLALLGGAGVYLESLPLLMLTLFGFGTHSAFFGPVKYAILPQHLRDNELLSGNAYIDASTFLAILLGTIAGGKFVLGHMGILLIVAALVLVALLGYLSSRGIPTAPAPDPSLRLSFNLWRNTFDLIRQARLQREVFLCILGISWFWLIGSLFLAQIPSFAKEVLRADENVVVVFLTMFAVGIAVGSLLCSRWMHGAVHAKPVPLAALGMTLFALRLAMTSSHAVASQNGALMGIADFLRQPGNWRILADFFGLAVCGGLYSVPLYTLLQKSADKTYGARAIACNNLVNALFMVGAAAMAVGMLKLHFTIPQIFLAVGIINFFAAIYICKLLPFSLIGAFLKLVYRVRVEGLENYAKAGERVLIVANHTSFLDAALIASFLPERVTFAINTFIAQRRWMKPLLSLVNTLSLDPTNPFAAKALIETLRKDGKCMIFPEGRITITGSLMKIYEGPGMIADKAGAMILPVRIDGAQYSTFSHLRGKVRIRWFPRITLTVLPTRRFALPDDVKGRKRRQLAGEQLYDLMANMMFESSRIDSTLIKTLLEATRIHGRGHIVVEDPLRKPLSYGQFLTRTFVVARLIKRFVAKDEERIALMLPNVASTALAFFAIQTLGRVTAMINFSSGPSQVGSACRSGALKTVITSERFVGIAKLQAVVEAITSAGVRVLYLEEMQKELRFSDKILGLLSGYAPEAVIRWTIQSKPEDPAVLLFTSGSEGAPKGVLLSNRNILANRFQLASAVDFGPQDVVFNCLPMFHAFGLTGGTLLPLLSGIRTFFYPSPLHYRIVPEMIYDTNATIIFGTDTFLAGYARFAHPYDCHSLRYVFAGAERLKDETRTQWNEKFGLRVLEGYGATETAPVMSVNTAMHYRRGTVGRLLPGITARLEDVPGIDQGRQLFVKGPNVMLGYLKEDKPGVLQPLADGWYDTGDIVSIDPEGYVRIMGRTKRFAKIGGEMISLATVETVFAALWPEWNHAVVSVPDSRKGEALVLLTEKRDASIDPVREAFRNRGLSELSIPRRLVKVDKLPLLGTGKTDYVKARQIAMTED
jgi:acyl-[acyl-carrier-protein]-phospholipid O-acyltransferase / long-chain-fatty-acid--[acyl-carrier-protein] ligase